MGCFAMRTLGKTGLQVSPLGIGGGQGITSEDVLYAFDHGINYFFYSSDMHHCFYQKSADAIRTLCRQGSSVRDQIVLATVSYVNDPEKLSSILIDQFTELGIDYIDVFHWGWVTDKTDMVSLLKSVHRLKQASSFSRMFRQIQTAMQIQQERVYSINEELMRRGLVRYVGASFHSRNMARMWMRNLDVLMVRYNIAHTGIEQELVPYLSEEKANNPGVVVFNSAHTGNRAFHIPPPGYPSDQYIPSIPDCYRFALSHPWVDVVLTGPARRQEIELALQAVERGPFSEEEQVLMLRYGQQFQEQKKEQERDDHTYRAALSH